MPPSSSHNCKEPGTILIVKLAAVNQQILWRQSTCQRTWYAWRMTWRHKNWLTEKVKKTRCFWKKIVTNIQKIKAKHEEDEYLDSSKHYSLQVFDVTHNFIRGYAAKVGNAKWDVMMDKIHRDKNSFIFVHGLGVTMPPITLFIIRFADMIGGLDLG